MPGENRALFFSLLSDQPDHKHDHDDEHDGPGKADDPDHLISEVLNRVLLGMLNAVGVHDTFVAVGLVIAAGHAGAIGGAHIVPVLVVVSFIITG